MTKPLQVTDNVYEQLKKFRDEQGLTSFSNAIQVLLNNHKSLALERFHLVKDLEKIAWETFRKLHPTWDLPEEYPQEHQM